MGDTDATIDIAIPEGTYPVSEETIRREIEEEKEVERKRDAENGVDAETADRATALANAIVKQIFGITNASEIIE